MKAVRIKYYLVNSIASIFFITIVCALPSRAQTINLVPNPSFEDTLAVITGPRIYQSIKYWKGLDSNSNFAWDGVYMSYNNKYWALPLNGSGFQFPRTGEGVAALGEVYNNFAGNKRSTIRTRLKSKLVAGKIYCVRIYANYSDASDYNVADGLQLYFDNGGLDTMITVHNNTTGIFPTIVPQVALAKGRVLTDTMNWNLITGSFVANGTEEFLTIGNFKINDSITRIPIDPTSLNPCSCTDLLLDDVSVYPIDLANWLPPTYNYVLGDSATIGLPNYETPDAKWYTYTMQLIDSGSQIKVKPPSSGTKYICGIDMCNTMVYDTVTVVGTPLSNAQLGIKNFALRVYPNPTTDVVMVEHALGEKVYIYNAVGQLILTQAIKNNQAKCNVAHLANGMYVIKTKTQVGKFVKE
jgi:Secretion system C-terminal sorting domain